jgi:hypothetical protein
MFSFKCIKYWRQAVTASALLANLACKSNTDTHASAPRVTNSATTSTKDHAAPPGVCDLRSRPMNPFENPQKKATVLIFVRADCPISNHYAPEIQRLHGKYTSQGLAFWLVYSDPDTPETEITDHLKDYQLTVPALRDPQHALVKRAGATVTPEAAVFLADGRQVYCGRIDDRYADFGKERLAPTRRDLDEVLASITKNKTITPSRTKAVGCYIPDQSK